MAERSDEQQQDDDREQAGPASSRGRAVAGTPAIAPAAARALQDEVDQRRADRGERQDLAWEPDLLTSCALPTIDAGAAAEAVEKKL